MSTQNTSQPSPFAFTAENQEKASAFIARYPAGRQQSAVMPLLDLAQRQEGWVSQAAMDAVAAMLAMPPIRVYEVATFYTMFNLHPMGKHHVQVCTNLPCMLRGSDEVVKACRSVLGIDIGQTTADGMFTFSEVECLGACVNAPVVQIDDDYYEDLNAERIEKILNTLKTGGIPTPGSQSGRMHSAPEGGPTTLVESAAKGVS